MPTHMHLIVFDADFNNERLRQTINAMRQFTGRQLSNYCHDHMPAVFGQVIGSSQRQDRTNKFWQQSKHPVAIWSQGFGGQLYKGLDPELQSSVLFDTVAV